MSEVADLSARATDLIVENLSTAAKPCITSSFQSECVVLVHLLREEA